MWKPKGSLTIGDLVQMMDEGGGRGRRSEGYLGKNRKLKCATQGRCQGGPGSGNFR